MPICLEKDMSRCIIAMYHGINGKCNHQRAMDDEKSLIAYMQIYIRRAWIHMSKKRLNIFNVNTTLKQMTCEAVTTGVRRYPACDTGFSGACLEELIDAGNIEIIPGP